METNHPPVPICEDSPVFHDLLGTIIPFISKNAGPPLCYETQSSHRLQTITHSNSMVTLCTEGVSIGLHPLPVYISKERLSIAFLIMSRLHTVFSNYPGNYRDVIIWATCYLAYTLNLLELVNLQLNRLFTSILWLTYGYQRLPQATTYSYLLYR